MLEISRDKFVCALSDKNEAVARCKSGDIVVFHTRDCYNDQIHTDMDYNQRIEFPNPATGPLYIEGAEKGDILKVEILSIETAESGVMRTAPGEGAFSDILKERKGRIFEIKDGKILFNEKLSIPINTMIGVIGTAPADGESISTETPREHGGNMDCRKIVAGTTIYLPVNTEGALLALGDLHANMGDGEAMICGLECRGEVTVKVTAIKDVQMPTPFLDYGDGVCTIQSAETLEKASIMAARRMHGYLMKLGLSGEEAGMLLSLQGNLIICQIVDPLLTVRMELPKYILDAYGMRLP